MNTPLALGTKAWIERINSAYDRVHATWQQSVEDILALGIALLAARESLAKGEYTNMLHNQLKFSAATATRVIKIAECDRIFSHVKILPPHWGTLYQLSRLDDATFDKAIKSGVVRPDMERSEVPAIPRNLSAHGRPLGRPRKPPTTIEGTATEVQPEALPMAEPPQPPKPAGPMLASVRAQQPPGYFAINEEPIQLRENVQLNTSPREDAVQVRFSPTDHVRNFWQALLILLGEWEKLGSLDGLVPDEETETLLQEYDLGRVIEELDMLRVALLEDPGAAA